MEEEDREEGRGERDEGVERQEGEKRRGGEERKRGKVNNDSETESEQKEPDITLLLISQNTIK